MFKRFHQQYKGSEFIRNILTLMTGTAIAQIIPVLISPLLTRIFSEDDFAVFALFLSITGILSSLATGRYDLAIMLPVRWNKARSVLVLSLSIAFFFCLFCLVSVLFFHRSFAGLLNNMRTEKWLFFVPLSVFLIAANSSFMYWFNRKKEYRTIAANKVLRNVTTAGLNMGIGVINAGAAGLIVGQMSGDAITTGIFGMHFFRKNKLTRWYFSHKTLAATAFEYRDFPLFSLPATFLDTLSIQAPIMLISRWFTERLTGYYFFAFRIMSAPMALLGAAVAQTFYQKFTEIIQAGGIGAKRFLLRIWLNLFLIAVVPITVIFFFGPSLFQFVFGAGWEESGKIASILAPYILISFISSPTSTTYMVLRMQNISFIFSVIALCYRLMAIFIGYYLGDFFMGLKILVACELIQIVIYNYIIYRKL